MTEQKPLTKKELVTEISKTTRIRRDVVNEVFDGLVDVAMEELSNRGTFQILGLFSVYSTEWKGYTSGTGAKITPHRRLRLKLSGNARMLFKMKERNPSVKITRDNWREITSKFHARRDKKNDSPEDQDDVFDEMLEEDE